MALIMFMAIFATTTYQRNLVWKDDFSLWSDIVKKSPNKARVHNAIGMYYYTRQRHGEAIPFFQQSLSLQPEYAFGHNNLDSVFWERGG